MIGGIVGDIVGSALEKHNCKSKAFEPLFHADAKFTDDTVCITAIGEVPVTGETQSGPSRLRRGNIGIAVDRGQRFRLWLAEDEPHRAGSLGNRGQ